MEMQIDPIFVAYREMRIRNLPEQTIAAHLFNIKKFIFRIDKPLEEVTESDLKDYLEKETSNKSGAYPKLISNSLSFFFNEILKFKLKPYDQEPIKMSVVLSQDDYAN